MLRNISPNLTAQDNNHYWNNKGEAKLGRNERKKERRRKKKKKKNCCEKKKIRTRPHLRSCAMCGSKAFVLRHVASKKGAQQLNGGARAGHASPMSRDPGRCLRQKTTEP
ncbi:hypothetical protein CDAR_100791 [Caerostris darwini]|uniref:Uncharacterized protein n=1 Tax=Caerostris darwini TaxID=1538125 RepID=A0AAV4VUA8_9ARAC|nr:hypothetical protein CDAR_100791 [Caerostris darwini]